MATAAANELRGDALEVLVALLEGGNVDEAIELIRRLVARNHDLERRLAELTAKRRTKETVSGAQLRLLLEGLAIPRDNLEPTDARGEADSALLELTALPEEAEEPKKRRKPPRRTKAPESLPRIECELVVPPEERACPKCGVERTCIGHDVTEVIDLIPAQVVVRLDKREKLACRACESEIARAPMGAKLVAGGMIGARLGATIVKDKFWDGLPLHRQRSRFEQMGWPVSVSTLTDQVRWFGESFEIVQRAALEDALARYVFALDATGLPVLDRAGPRGIRIGSLWTYMGDEEVMATLYTSTGHKVAKDPSQQGPEQVLARRSGYALADASNSFDASFERDDLIEAGCNMHARRKFVAALDGGDKRASLPVSAFRVIYQIEDEVRGTSLEAIAEARFEKTRLVYAELVRWCGTYQPHEPPSSPLGQAVRYLLNHQVALMRFIDDPRLPPDNGALERRHVRVGLSRKNFLFAGSDEGGKRAAIAYTVLGCCDLVGVDPIEYIVDVLPRLQQPITLAQARELLPHVWKRNRLPPS
jgi:transposase